MKETLGPGGGRDSAEIAVPKRGFVDPRCNECGDRVSRLAGVAKNALMNGDFARVIAVLGELGAGREAASGGADTTAGAPGRPGN
jgi:hypothetical protein